MMIRVFIDTDRQGESGDDSLNTDHRHPVEAHRTGRASLTVDGEVHDVAVWLLSHYGRLDEEDRLAPLMGLVVL